MRLKILEMLAIATGAPSQSPSCTPVTDAERLAMIARIIKSMDIK